MVDSKKLRRLGILVRTLAIQRIYLIDFNTHSILSSNIQIKRTKSVIIKVAIMFYTFNLSDQVQSIPVFHGMLQT